jgi:hypothetical protein
LKALLVSTFDLKCDFLVSKFAFHKCNLYRYIKCGLIQSGMTDGDRREAGL